MKNEEVGIGESKKEMPFLLSVTAIHFFILPSKFVPFSSSPASLRRANKLGEATCEGEGVAGAVSLSERSV
jgi:hypothetical protein